MGAGGPKHDRSLHAFARHNELLGRARREHPDFAVGRCQRKFATAPGSSGLPAYSPDGARVAGTGRRSRQFAVSRVAASPLGGTPARWASASFLHLLRGRASPGSPRDTPRRLEKELGGPVEDDLAGITG